MKCQPLQPTDRIYSSGLVVWITAQASCAMRAAEDFAQQEKPRTAQHQKQVNSEEKKRFSSVHNMPS